jgi:hypothetical protein
MIDISLRICSNVTNNILILSGSNLANLPDIIRDTIKINNGIIEKCIFKRELMLLHLGLTNTLNEISANFKEPQVDKFTPLVELSYMDKVFRLNYRSQNDFKIGILISLFEIIDKSVNANGNVFVFNRNELRKFSCDSIILILSKIKNGHISLIRKKLGSLSAESISFEIPSAEDIELGLQLLVNNGYVELNKENLYELTTKGYMLSLP